jgi:hypothetical protein
VSVGLSTGLLLFVVGVFVLLRTVVKDSEGRNLVDRIVDVAKG